jgi:hypothetical protein
VIALDRADEENGGFDVLSGTHAGGAVTFDYDTSDSIEAPSTRRVER